jgi:hypothetical protein
LSKAEWGIKRVCAKCAAPFYDLHRFPIRCPKCDTEFRAATSLVRSGAAKRAVPTKGTRAKSVPAPSAHGFDDPVPGSPPRRATDEEDEDLEREDEDEVLDTDDEDVEDDSEAEAGDDSIEAPAIER